MSQEQAVGTGGDQAVAAIWEKVSSQGFSNELRQLVEGLIANEQEELQRQNQEAQLALANNEAAIVAGLDREPQLSETVVQQIQNLFNKYRVITSIRELQDVADELLPQMLDQGLRTELKTALERAIYAVH